jgi:hypothetical protein
MMSERTHICSGMLNTRWLICRDFYRSHRTPKAAPAVPMTSQHLPASQQQHGPGWRKQQPQPNMTYPPTTQIPPVYSAALGNGIGSTVSGWPMAQTGETYPTPGNYAARPQSVPS